MAAVFTLSKVSFFGAGLLSSEASTLDPKP